MTAYVGGLAVPAVRFVPGVGCWWPFLGGEEWRNSANRSLVEGAVPTVRGRAGPRRTRQRPRRFRRGARAGAGHQRPDAPRLHELATAGLITRTVLPGPPLRSQYALTAHGRAFLIPLAALAYWAEDHLPPHPETRLSHSP
ncbi:winged helix-turn-helix transcriptional regulator [Streptomyces sp. R41]|uniref:Winged helix-turn-helix transcriptional regulator n=1 Tax=Streptomyces sp. R41 TaxID=3238632 RepID=A0AB39RJY7_9ACTN